MDIETLLTLALAGALLAGAALIRLVLLGTYRLAMALLGDRAPAALRGLRPPRARRDVPPTTGASGVRSAVSASAIFAVATLWRAITIVGTGSKTIGAAAARAGRRSWSFGSAIARRASAAFRSMMKEAFLDSSSLEAPRWRQGAA